MTDQEEIDFRDRARLDFEGKEIDGNVIFQVLVDTDSNARALYFSDKNYNEIKNWFPLDDYDLILSQCKKPFPKGGFQLEGRTTSEILNLSHFVCRFHKCNAADIDHPVITLQELKDEGQRIIDSM